MEGVPTAKPGDASSICLGPHHGRRVLPPEDCLLASPCVLWGMHRCTHTFLYEDKSQKKRIYVKELQSVVVALGLSEASAEGL